MFKERNKHKKIISFTGFLCIVLVIGLICSYWIDQHWKNKETITDRVEVHEADEEQEGFIEGNDRDTGILVQDSIRSILKDPDAKDCLEIQEYGEKEYSEPVFYTVGHTLARGAYTATIHYETDQNGSYAVVFSPNEMGSDATSGQTGREISRAELPAGTTEISIPFQLTESVEDVEVQIYFGGGDFKIYTVVTERSDLCTDQIWNLIFLLILLGVLFYLFEIRYSSENRRDNRLVLFILLLASLYTCLPLMNDFLYVGHDEKFHLGRLDGIAQAFENGQFPMYLNMVQQKGYGEATPIMYPQVFLYLPALLMCAGMSLMNAYKLLLACLNVMGIVIAYFSFRGVFQRRGPALCAALSYCLCIFRLSETYTREALGESLAMCFLPLVFYGFYEIFSGNQKKWIWLAFGYTGVISSHVLTTMIVAVFSALYILILIPRLCKCHQMRRFLAFFKAVAVTILLNLYFLLPMMDYYLHENFNLRQDSDSGLSVNASGVYLSQLFGIFYSGDTDYFSHAYGQTMGELPLTIGLLLTGGMLLFVWLRFLDGKKQKSPASTLGTYSLFGAAVSIFLSLWIFPWQGIAELRFVNKLKSIQLVWRFLTTADLFASVVLGCAVIIFAERKPEMRRRMYAVVVLAAFACSFYYMDSISNNTSYYDRTLVNECGDDTLYLYPETDLSVQDQITIRSSAEGTHISNFTKNETTVTFSYQLPEEIHEATLSMPLYYYPNYHATMNGLEIPIQKDEQGLVSIQVSESSGNVSICYVPEHSWQAAELLSFLAWLAVIVYLCILNKKKKSGVRCRKQV